MNSESRCPDCDRFDVGRLTRRQFVKTIGATAAAVSATSLPLHALAAKEKGKKSPEKLVAKLYESFSEAQKKEVCFDWNHLDEGTPLRSHVSANWNITDPLVVSDFYTKDQQELIEAIFFGIYQPDWRKHIKKQLQDDCGGYGKMQSLALFGKPGSGKFELVITGRHLTVRCDGDSTPHVAFGGPIAYGHAASGFNEKPNHPGNVFWNQSLVANKLYKMLDGKQRKLALVEKAPAESSVHFRGKGAKFDGIPVSEFSKDQKAQIQKVLESLVEPYRTTDRDEAVRCVKAQGGLDKCSIAFYQSNADGESLDLGNDGVWDVWRLEGPSFVWHFRGAPHIHVWVNVANNASAKISTG